VSYHVRFEDLGIRDYKEVWDYQEQILSALKGQKLNDTDLQVPPGEEIVPHLLFVEHPHVYTLGKSGSENNLLIDYMQLQASEASFYHIDRGGDITYHGPGQIVGYPIFDLDALGTGLRGYINLLEEAVIMTLERYGLKGGRLESATGVWLDNDKGGRPRKICAIGVRVSRSVTMHGFAFNVNTELEYFNHINPCGFTDKGVTSLAREMGVKIDYNEAKSIMKESLMKVFDLVYI
jgi:lipoyl(octanoyl) transferase